MTPTSSAPTEFEEGLEWIRKNTNFPSLQEFMRNPDKYRNDRDDLFKSIETMNVYFKDRLKKTEILWRGKYKVSSLGQLRRIAQEEGFSGDELEYQPQVERMDGMSNQHDTRVQVKINVWPKIEFRLMGGVVAND